MRVLPVRKLTARVVGLATGVGKDVPSRAVAALDLNLTGIPGERHGGFERGANSRVPWYRRGEAIRNQRQLSLVAAEELEAIAAGLGLARVEAEWLGANVVVAGVPSFSFLPRGTLLFCRSGAVLTVSDQNAPCRISGRSIAAAIGGDEDLQFRFVEVARRLRGVVAAVDRAGRVREGDTISVRVPEQWVWEG